MKQPGKLLAFHKQQIKNKINVGGSAIYLAESGIRTCLSVVNKGSM